MKGGGSRRPSGVNQSQATRASMEAAGMTEGALLEASASEASARPCPVEASASERRRSGIPAMNVNSVSEQAFRGDPWDDSEETIVPTFEGFSVYSASSNLGKQVATLRGGTIFGEL